MLCLTLSLGVWQIERLHWKRALLAQIDQGEAAGPVPLSAKPTPFSRVIAEGIFEPAFALYGAEVRATPAGAAMGAHVVGVLRRSSDVPVLVDRGWAPFDVAVAMPSGPIRLEGYVRPAERASWSAAQDDPARRRFFTLDPGVIAGSIIAEPVAPFTLVVLGPANGYPEPAGALPRPPNDHLSYAITWFSLSAILTGVFALFARQTLRKAPAP